ncbi:PEP-CTERM sorting domain-containing protein [Coraliomargarita akajimensis]|uniref:Ice-binding protein C-terminal domain-containing protein n=1 Tax=Coraliomargarita akajimensis (strain DSM 45221 / IAM 15411 / JCM 23193 / KCTC 12865 / 04OKA010-24) TaxID=583355 RepID=D5EMZ6_CORAD|nr:PEP-CTERM sorting domain-containing protein [Coraliomargarita akajimensis]ADE55386.1 protein of unknown function DUF1555 [Coraliomargarita akajimensis DSM 45221]
MLKKIILSALIPAAGFATGVNFQTTLGDVLLADNSTTLENGALLRIGTMSTSDFTGFTTIGDYEGVFSELGTSSFSGGEASLVLLPGATTAGTALYGIAYAGATSGNAESAVFYLGDAPDLGLLSSTPSGSTVLYGTKTDNNINLAAVPEPSTAAALAGIAALGYVVARRRRS